MATHTRESLQQALENQIRRLAIKIDDLEKLNNRLSGARLIAFIGGLALVYFAGTLGNEWIFWIALVAFILGFGKLLKEHKKVDRAVKKFSVWKSIRSTHLARQQMEWSKIPEKHLSKNYTGHPFANDLDIIGKHSLLQLIDTSTYEGSTDQLTEYLLNKEPEASRIKERQRVVQELAVKPEFRDRLHLLAELNQEQELEDDWTLEELSQHLRQSKRVNYTMPLLLLGCLSVANIILGLLFLAGIIDPYVIFTLVLYLVAYNFNSEKISGLYEEAYQIEKLLSRFNTVLGFLETYKYKPKSKLKEFCHPFWSSNHSPSKFVNRIIRIAGAASSQQSDVVWALLNFLMPWDLYFTQKLSAYKQELAPQLSRWINRFYKLEAYTSMANFAWLNPHYIFSAPDENNKPLFKATGLGHPLIPENQKVTNDITINGKGEILLITGSNMAGKSTFLRTMGINLALCFAGAPVNASSFSVIPFRIFSSINVTDSLDSGLSHFYTEVKNLKRLLTLLEDNHPTPVFFMVDEIYRGTNNRERLQGSRAFLQEVASKNGVGLVSTHDLELAQLEKTISELSNWHFEETIESGKMSFEYKLKPGPCPTTNALKIMEMEGLPV